MSEATARLAELFDSRFKIWWEIRPEVFLAPIGPERLVIRTKSKPDAWDVVDTKAFVVFEIKPGLEFRRKAAVDYDLALDTFCKIYKDTATNHDNFDHFWHDMRRSSFHLLRRPWYIHG
jgi:hypothetical protein